MGSKDGSVFPVVQKSQWCEMLFPSPPPAFSSDWNH